MSYKKNKIELDENGYSIIPNLYSNDEIEKILFCIENAILSETSFSKTKDIFAIRQLIHTIPELKTHLFNTHLTTLVASLFQSDYFLTKAIYFDKPGTSNWFVAYHQDLSISVTKKMEIEGYCNWTHKKGQYGVQPPIHILQNTITVRIHLDDTDQNNGALRVVPKSHLQGIIRKESKDWNTETEYICNINKGGAMLMKPLTLHASNKTTNQKQRRVIHLEFSNQTLTKSIDWLEYHRVLT